MNTAEILQAKDLRIQVLEEQLTACKSDRERLKKQLKLYNVVSGFKMQGSRDGHGWECITLAKTEDEARIKTIQNNPDSADIRLIRNYGKPIF